MENSFSRDDFMMKILPWWFFLWFLILFWEVNITFENPENYDFLFSFIFICFSFITWEILQILSHTDFFEFLAIKSWFRNRLPSEVFLYKNNPVISNEDRDKIVKKLKIKKDIPIDLEYHYNNIPYERVKTKNYNVYNQKIFRIIYTPIKNTETIKKSNIYYLFLRSFLLELLFIDILLFYRWYLMYGIINLFISLIISKRLYNVSKKLIYHTVKETLYSKNSPNE